MHFNMYFLHFFQIDYQFWRTKEDRGIFQWILPQLIKKSNREREGIFGEPLKLDWRSLPALVGRSQQIITLLFIKLISSESALDSKNSKKGSFEAAKKSKIQKLGPTRETEQKEEEIITNDDIKKLFCSFVQRWRRLLAHPDIVNKPPF